MRPRLILATLLGGLFITNIDLAIANIAVPSMRATLGASGAEVQLVVGGYIVSYAMFLITAARLGQTRGYRRAFMCGITIFTVASVACGLAPNPPLLIGARLVQGIGGALMVAQVLSGIQLTFSGEARVRAVGAYAVVLSVGAVVGQVAGGVIVAADLFGAGWRPAFLVNLPIGIGLLACAARALPRDGQRGTQPLDIRGVGLLSIAVVLMIVPLTLGREAGWPTWTWVCVAASVPVFGAFVALERRQRAPLVNLGLLREARVGWGLLAASSSLSTYHALLFVLAMYLQQGLGASALLSGLAPVSWVAAFGLSGPLLARCARRRVRLLAAIGYMTLAAAYVGLAIALLAGQARNPVLLVGLLGLGGLGFGIGRNCSIADMTAAVSDRFAPDMSGLINTSSQLAGAAGVAALGTLYLDQSGAGAIVAFSLVMAVLGAVALASAGAAALAMVAHAQADARTNLPPLATRRVYSD